MAQDNKPSPTPTFAPSRFKLARACRGYSMKYMADMFKVSPQTISNYENGTTRPQEIDKIAILTEFPTEFFFGDDVEIVPEDVISFRAKKSLTATVRDRAIARSTIAWQFISPAFHKRFEFPSPDLPDLHNETPESAARILRNYWGLGNGPVSNLVHICESKGIEIFWINEDSPCVDAFCYRRNNHPFVFLNTTKTAGERGRFDLAHELAHLVCDQNEKESKDRSDREKEARADQFASAFLLPEDRLLSLCRVAPTLDALRPIKRQWGISIAALIVRLHRAGIYSDFHYHRAWKEMWRREWRIHEPDAMPRERSYAHEVFYTRLFDKGITPTNFASSISVNPQELYELTPASQGFRNVMGRLRLVESAD